MTSSATVNQSGQHAWEDTENADQLWQGVAEDAHGNLIRSTQSSLATLIRQRRKRLAAHDYVHRHQRVVRDMIRYVYVLLDASRWMRVKDPVLPPNSRVDVTIGLLQTFLAEFFDQNPLSHIGFCLLKNGEAEVLSPLSSSIKSHQLALQALRSALAAENATAGGEFSLQNGLELAGRSLGHQPRHGSREIVLLTAALCTCDPGNLLETLAKLQRAHIRVSCLALAAELHVCRKMAEETGGTMGVCLDKAHLREWLSLQTVPPPKKDPLGRGDDHDHHTNTCEMVRMGFPLRHLAVLPELVHATRDATVLSRTSYTCPNCQARNAELPTDCAVCGLKLVLAPHLAPSFHHLFPVPPFVEKALPRQRTRRPVAVTSTSETTALVDEECRGCRKPFVVVTATDDDDHGDEVLRFQCPDCQHYFCVDCDTYLHEALHNCPGCLTK